VAQISDEDFNALFRPLGERAGILLFDLGKEQIDEGAKAMLDRLWSDRRGGSYFFVVGRASTDGTTAQNQALSHRRVNSVLFHLQDRFRDQPELEDELGLLWLGEEYAQLGTDFCAWHNSRPEAPCTTESLNRSVVVSWIDCRL
jgi:outer membrane protein OmpA-like peptidoglycan-associated protein